jgi:hypothetical protein
MLLSLLLLLSKILFWIPAEVSDEGRSSLSSEATFPGLSIAVVSRASLRYLSKTTVAIRFLGVPRFVQDGAFPACSSSVSYHSKAPIHSTILRIVTSLDQAWPASSMLIHIEADQVIGLFVIHTEPGRPAISVGVTVPPRLGRSVLRILE